MALSGRRALYSFLSGMGVSTNSSVSHPSRSPTVLHPRPDHPHRPEDGTSPSGIRGGVAGLLHTRAAPLNSGGAATTMEDEALISLIEMTGLDAQQATSLLEAAGGDLAIAAALHFEDPHPAQAPPPPPPPPPPPAPSASVSRRFDALATDDSDDDDDEAEQPTPGQSPQPTLGQSPRNSAGRSSKAGRRRQTDVLDELWSLEEYDMLALHEASVADREADAAPDVELWPQRRRRRGAHGSEHGAASSSSAAPASERIPIGRRGRRGRRPSGELSSDEGGSPELGISPVGGGSAAASPYAAQSSPTGLGLSPGLSLGMSPRPSSGMSPAAMGSASARRRARRAERQGEGGSCSASTPHGSAAAFSPSTGGGSAGYGSVEEERRSGGGAGRSQSGRGGAPRLAPPLVVHGFSPKQPGAADGRPDAETEGRRRQRAAGDGNEGAGLAERVMSRLRWDDKFEDIRGQVRRAATSRSAAAPRRRALQTPPHPPHPPPTHPPLSHHSVPRPAQLVVEWSREEKKERKSGTESVTHVDTRTRESSSRFDRRGSSRGCGRGAGRRAQEQHIGTRRPQPQVHPPPIAGFVQFIRMNDPPYHLVTKLVDGERVLWASGWRTDRIGDRRDGGGEGCGGGQEVADASGEPGECAVAVQGDEVPEEVWALVFANLRACDLQVTALPLRATQTRRRPTYDPPTSLAPTPFRPPALTLQSVASAPSPAVGHRAGCGTGEHETAKRRRGARRVAPSARDHLRLRGRAGHHARRRRRRHAARAALGGGDAQLAPASAPIAVVSAERRRWRCRAGGAGDGIRRGRAAGDRRRRVGAAVVHGASEANLLSQDALGSRRAARGRSELHRDGGGLAAPLGGWRRIPSALRLGGRRGALDGLPARPPRAHLRLRAPARSHVRARPELAPVLPPPPSPPPPPPCALRSGSHHCSRLAPRPHPHPRPSGRSGPPRSLRASTARSSCGTRPAATSLPCYLPRRPASRRSRCRCASGTRTSSFAATLRFAASTWPPRPWRRACPSRRPSRRCT